MKNQVKPFRFILLTLCFLAGGILTLSAQDNLATAEKTLTSDKDGVVLKLNSTDASATYQVYVGTRDRIGNIDWTPKEEGTLKPESLTSRETRNTDAQTSTAKREICHRGSQLIKVILRSTCDECATVSFKDCR